MTPLQAALAAAEAAASAIRADFGQPAEQFAKGHLDFATPTDVRAEQIIVAALRAAFPDYGVMAEESGVSAGREGAPWWLIDPLCGTVNFAIGLPLFNINIALMEGGRPVLGVLAEPLANEVMWAEAGRGAHLRRAGGAVTPLRPSPDTHILGVDFGHYPAEGDPGPMLRLFANATLDRRMRTRILNTSLALGYVARGRLAAFAMDNTKPWDQGAGGFICREAGCVVTDLEGREWTPGAAGIIAAADEATAMVVRELLG